jgi:membrane fusion protein (multidrug efflux system)
MKLLRSLVVIAASVAVVLLAHHFIRRSEPAGRPRGGETPVIAEIIQPRDFADRTEAVGTATAEESVLITPAVSERVARILFEDGEKVEAGDVLVELEHDEEAAALEEARANLAEESQRFERMKALGEQDLVAQEELDTSQTNLEAARARFLSAEARLRDRIITAPFYGVVGMRRVSPGALVTPGEVITTLDDLSYIKVDFTVPEALLSDILLGQPVSVRSAAWPDDAFDGRVTSIDSRVDPTTRAVGVQARIPNGHGKLRVGMLLTVELTCCPREAPGVPERALLSYADRQYVYLIRAGRTVSQQEVKLGTRDVGWVEVREGLGVGDTIVVDGLLNLRDGASVRIESFDASQESAE